MSGIYDYLVFGNIISFDIHPSAIIGSRWEDVTVLAILDKETANMWIDADTMHVNVFPYLPSGTPDDADSYQYVKVKHPNGEVSVIGIPWIVSESIEVSGSKTLTITMNNISPMDKDRIITALAANGYRPDSTKFQ